VYVSRSWPNAGRDEAPEAIAVPPECEIAARTAQAADEFDRGGILGFTTVGEMDDLDHLPRDSLPARRTNRTLRKNALSSARRPFSNRPQVRLRAQSSAIYRWTVADVQLSRR
jgi:hypothetical protein